MGDIHPYGRLPWSLWDEREEVHRCVSQLTVLVLGMADAQREPAS